MAFKRESIMFRVDASLPDPDIVKFNFRRRVFFLSLLGALVLLSIPVLKDRLPAMNANGEAKIISTWILDQRLAAANTRRAHTLFLDPETQSKWFKLENTSDCKSPELQTGQLSHETKAFLWRIVRQKKDGSGTFDISRLCFDPKGGIFADGNPLAGEDELALVVGPQEDKESGRQDRLHHILLAEQGDLLSLR